MGIPIVPATLKHSWSDNVIRAGLDEVIEVPQGMSCQQLKYIENCRVKLNNLKDQMYQIKERIWEKYFPCIFGGWCGATALIYALLYPENQERNNKKFLKQYEKLYIEIEKALNKISS